MLSRITLSALICASPLSAQQIAGRTAGRTPQAPWLVALDHTLPVAPALRFVPSSSLQRCVDQTVLRLDLTAMVRERRFGASLADLSSPNGDVPFAGVAPDQMLYAASVPKVAALGAAFQLRADVRAGKIALSLSDPGHRVMFYDEASHAFASDFTSPFRQVLRQMIYRSSNSASNQVITAVTYPFIASYVVHAGLYDADGQGGLWLGAGFGHITSWRADPVAHRVHGATPRSLALFYALLARDQLVDASSSQEMRELLGDSAFFNRFRKALLTRYPTASIYRKTGTWRGWRNDSALVVRPGATYTLAALCNDTRCSTLLESVALAFDSCVGHRAP